jgi:hypothetical protein
MLSQPYSKTKFVRKNTGTYLDVKKINEMSYKKDELYFVKDGGLEKEKEIVYETKNIFSVYDSDIHTVYKHISELLNEACENYSIDKAKQQYMIYGKISNYKLIDNNNWYDFPGINIPQLHGMYFFEDTYLTFNNNDLIEKEHFYKKDIFINKPTDLINVNVLEDSKILEFYIFPIELLKHNEPGVWLPIL